MLSLSWLAGAVCVVGCAVVPSVFAQTNVGVSAEVRAPHTTRSFARIEATFHIPNLEGDPFDFEANDVRVQLRLPNDKLLSLPAFFDGDDTWRVRHTPTTPGNYQVVAVTRNGQKLGVTPNAARFAVNGASEPGFVGIDPKNPLRFRFDSGARYYPLGTNQAWLSGKAGEYTERFAKMAASGQNWSRVWMNHWDNKNLDWAPDGRGGWNLPAARRWDEVVEAATKSGIYFQIVTQHHGQYSTQVNPNWEYNPYNIKNGGFLKEPNDFFTDEHARTLTKRKLRYAIARYGYSPHVLAWELWNEVQLSDAGLAKNWDVITRWHREMSDFLRAQDAYGHLITTSSEAPPAVYAPVDYYQRHTYASSLVSELSHAPFADKEWALKPGFVGEYGPAGEKTDEWTMHSGLWASLLSDSAGAAQYWYNDRVEEVNWYGHFQSASNYLKSADFSERDVVIPFRSIPLDIQSTQRGPLILAPGASWESVPMSEFDLSKPSDVAEFSRYPRYFQGQYHRDMNPRPLVLHFVAPTGGELHVRLSQIAKAGANIRITAYGQSTDFSFAATPNDLSVDKILSVTVGAGAQTVTIENTGLDWVVLRDITVPGAVPLLQGVAKAAPACMMAWFYHRTNIDISDPQTHTNGTATVPGLQVGTYTVTWWDTVAGKSVKTETRSATPAGLKLEIPPITRDIAMWAVKK